MEQLILDSVLHACVLQDVEKLDKLVTKLNKDKVGCQAALQRLAMHHQSDRWRSLLANGADKLTRNMVCMPAWQLTLKLQSRPCTFQVVSTATPSKYAKACTGSSAKGSPTGGCTELTGFLQGFSVGIHVDGASGGFVAPFVQPDLKWDFRLKNVVSINASGHKYGLVYPGPHTAAAASLQLLLRARLLMSLATSALRSNLCCCACAAETETWSCAAHASGTGIWPCIACGAMAHLQAAGQDAGCCAASAVLCSCCCMRALHLMVLHVLDIVLPTTMFSPALSLMECFVWCAYLGLEHLPSARY